MSNVFRSPIFLVAVLFALDGLAADKPLPHSRAEALALAYPEQPDTIVRKPVTIWSDGTRMAADFYLPKDTPADAKLPAIVIVNGTGGMKRKLPARIAHHFVEAGYAFLAIDYRGWGESDSRLMMVEPMPEPDAKEELTVKVRALRWQVDFADQAADVRAAIAWLGGEKNVDPERIGLFGTSYGGGLATWVAANDSRVKCLVVQVPGMGRMRNEGNVKGAYALQTKQVRAETEPVPFETNKLGGKLSKYGHMRRNLSKWVGYDPISAAKHIKAPTLIVDAGADELLNYKNNGGVLAAELKKAGAVHKHHVIKEMTHYGVYRQHLDEVIGSEVGWFNKYLKGAATTK
jgi:acetyl esterase/lipase